MDHREYAAATYDSKKKWGLIWFLIIIALFWLLIGGGMKIIKDGAAKLSINTKLSGTTASADNFINENAGLKMNWNTAQSLGKLGIANSKAKSAHAATNLWDYISAGFREDVYWPCNEKSAKTKLNAKVIKLQSQTESLMASDQTYQHANGPLGLRKLANWFNNPMMVVGTIGVILLIIFLWKFLSNRKPKVAPASAPVPAPMPVPEVAPAPTIDPDDSRLLEEAKRAGYTGDSVDDAVQYLVKFGSQNIANLMAGGMTEIEACRFVYCR